MESQQRVLSLAGNVTPPLPVNSSNTMKDITHTGSISADRGQQLLPQGVNSAKGGGTKPVSQKQRQVIETLYQQRGISPDSVYHDLCDRPLADLRGQDAHKMIPAVGGLTMLALIPYRGTKEIGWGVPPLTPKMPCLHKQKAVKWAPNESILEDGSKPLAWR